MSLNKTKKQRQYQIMEAAMEVFVKRGYANTRMDDIVKKSGLSKGAIYHHYASKKDLFISLIDHWEIYSFPDFYIRTKSQRNSSEILLDFANAVVDVFKNRKHVFLAEVEFWALSNQDHEINERSRSLYEKLLNLFQLVVEKGIRNGEFVNNDPRMIALLLLSAFQGINWFCVFGDKKLRAEQYIIYSTKLILKSIEKRK